MPRFEEFGRFIDAIDIRQENLFRLVFLGLNTWARPQTIIDFRDNAAAAENEAFSFCWRVAGKT